MKLNLRRMLKDRKVQLGLVAAAILGTVTLVRRQQQGGAGADEGSGSTPQTLQPAVMDSTGTDIYNAMQSLGQGWEQDLRDYSSKLDDLKTQIGKISSGPAATKPPATKPPSGTVKPPVVKPKPKPKPAPATKKYATVAKFTTKNPAWNSTLSGIAKHYGVSVTTLRKLNPTIKNINLIHPGQKVRYK